MSTLLFIKWDEIVGLIVIYKFCGQLSKMIDLCKQKLGL